MGYGRFSRVEGRVPTARPFGAELCPEARCLFIAQPWGELQILLADRHDGRNVLGATHQHDLLAANSSIDELVESRLCGLDGYRAHTKKGTLHRDSVKGLTRARGSRYWVAIAPSACDSVNHIIWFGPLVMLEGRLLAFSENSRMSPVGVMRPILEA
jgi:hypothetical protein